mgnify:CR=1 FL=1
MKEIDVKIVELEPMKVVSIYGFGERPENLAWQNMQDWVEKHNIELDPDKHRIFGFNNPCPSAGSSRYGYEFWLALGDEMEGLEPEGEVRIVEFDGGMYGVVEFSIEDVGKEFPQYWNALNVWCEKSKYSVGQHQWLEEHNLDQEPFAMYLPIK